MDGLTMLVTALISGAIAGSKGVATQVVTDCYNGLKKLISGHAADTSAVDATLKQVEENGDLQVWEPALRDAVSKLKLAADAEISAMAKKLCKLLEEEGIGKTAMTATVTGSGAVAQGTDSVAAGEGGTAIGTVKGNVTIGERS